MLKIDEATVSKSLEDLGRRSLVRAVHRGDSRASRYRHLMSESMNLHLAETAVMCVLMLRGAQTVGEVRTRTARLFEFADLALVDITLQALMTLPVPLVGQLPRRPGQKEVRYAHLLSGEPRDDAPDLGAAEDLVGTDQSRPSSSRLRPCARSWPNCERDSTNSGESLSKAPGLDEITLTLTG